MSNAADGGGTTAVELEFDSIDAAVAKMTKIADTINALETKFKGFATSVQTSAWSSESSCEKFGTSYKAAVTVYADVIAGMKQDLSNYAAALQSASNEYKKSDANSADALAKLGTVDDAKLSQDAQGQGTYHDKPNHQVLSSDDPNQATDTTKNDDTGATTMPGSSPNAAPSNGGAGQSTQVQPNAGTSQGGPNGGNGATPYSSPSTSLPTQPTGTNSGGQR